MDMSFVAVVFFGAIACALYVRFTAGRVQKDIESATGQPVSFWTSVLLNRKLADENKLTRLKIRETEMNVRRMNDRR